MKKIILPLAIATVLLVGCSSSEQGKDSRQKIALVKVQGVHATDVEQRAEFTGSIEAYIENNISPSLGLRIDNIYVEVGDRVSSGQVLVEMDKRQYLQAAVQLANLESDFLRMSKLYQEGGISRQQLDQLETQLKVSRHATENLRENSDLVSPISGVVTARNYDPGDMYSPSVGSILTVMQINRVKVLANISERYFPAVKIGMPVDVGLDIYPNDSFKGKVSLIHPALDPATRTFTVEVTIDNPSLKLRPGMMCKTRLGFGTQHNVLVPDIAVLKQQGSSERYLFAMEPDSTVTRRVVEIGRLVGKDYEIISGVKDGEIVVTAGMQKLLEGERVTTVK